jgi:predicted membrane-bound spermidine synthase
MYHVIGTGLTVTLLYVISYSFSRLGLFSIQTHRKLWNLVLAAAFLLTALAGLFLALQITYKWNVPVIKSILSWHVEFGIGMAFAGIFHFLWHITYFTKIFNRQTAADKIPELQKLTSPEISINLFVVGFVSSSVQLLLMREVMNISGGYELITGTFLASWLTGSAIGSALAARSSLNSYRKINLIFAMSPVISLFLLFFLARMLFNPGETPSFLTGIIYTFLVLMPFCLVSGFTFIKLISGAYSFNGFSPGRSFSIETTGGVAAGIFISLMTSGILGTYQLFLLILLSAVSYVLLSYVIENDSAGTAIKIAIAVIAALIIISKPDTFFRQILLPAIQVTDSKDTPYGNITHGEYKDEQSTYYNQRLLKYADDATEREENIHYAMLQSKAPEEVIIISGQLRSHLAEIEKYPVKKVIYIERDPALTEYEISGKHSFSGELAIVNNDAFRYIRKSGEKADVIISLIPPPSTLLLSRFYTTEFFADVKKRLKSDGIFMCSPGPGDTYFNRESLNLYSSVFSSLSAVFRNVKPVNGNKLYLIASDKDISLDFCQLTEKRNIRNIYVSSSYLSDDLIKAKSDEILSLINTGGKQNRAAFPVATFHFQSYNFSKSIDERIPAIVLLIVLFAIPVLGISRKNMLMYFCASALAGYEIVVLITVQLILGNMYQLTGLVIACLMTGLAVGSGSDFRIFRSFNVQLKGFLLIIFYILTGLLYNRILALNSWSATLCLLCVLTFLPSLLTGYVFRELTSSSEGYSRTPAIYSADLTGSATGFILISSLAIPVAGIKISIFLLSGLILSGLIFNAFKTR